MSELYEHLKRLEDQEKRLRDEGGGVSVPLVRPQSHRQKKRSKAVLFAIPAVFLALGLLTVLSVSILKKTVHEKNPAREPPTQAPQVAQKMPPITESVPSPAPLPVPEKSTGGEALLAGLNQTRDGWTVGADRRETGERSSGPSTEGPRVRVTAAASTPSPGGLGFQGPEKRPEEPKRFPKRDAAPKAKWGKEPPVETSRQVLIIAEEARRAGDWEGAERGYREYLTTKNDPTVLNNLGALLMARGLFAEAEQVLTRAYDQSRDPDIAANLWASLWRQGKKEAACRLALSLKDDPSAARLAPAMSRLTHQCPPGP